MDETRSYVPGADLFGRDRLADYSKATTTVDWTDPDLAKVVRVKLVTDPGFPYADVSYAYGDLKDGTPVRVRLPFHQLPRTGMIRAIVQYAERAGVHAKKLGVFDAIAWD